MQSMKCRYCKREITENSIFCSWCGKKQIAERDEIRVPEPKKLPSGNYRGQLMIDGVRHSITTGTKREYYARVTALKTELIKAKDTTTKKVGDAIDEYIDARSNIISPSTLKSYKMVRKMRFQSIMEKQCADMTLNQIQQAVNTEAAQCSYKTIKNALGVLVPAIRPYTVDVDFNAIALPPKRTKDIAVYDDAQLVKLFKAVEGDDIELAVLLAAALGLRRSEILALTSDDFNRREKTVTISKAVVPDEFNMLVVKTTKTDRSQRTLPCPDFILALVPEHSDGYIYGGTKQSYLLNRLKRICKANGLPDITLHGLRHSNASAMLLVMPDKYAMARGGWSSQDTMKYIYQHRLDSKAAEYDKAITEHFEALKAKAEAV